MSPVNFSSVRSIYHRARLRFQLPDRVYLQQSPYRGGSTGGYLIAMIDLTSGDPKFGIGNNLNQSGAVSGLIDESRAAEHFNDRPVAPPTAAHTSGLLRIGRRLTLRG